MSINRGVYGEPPPLNIFPEPAEWVSGDTFPRPPGETVLIPLCAPTEMIVPMLSAMKLGAEILYPDNPVEIHFWLEQALEFVNQPNRAACGEFNIVYPVWNFDQALGRGRWEYPLASGIPPTDWIYLVPQFRGDRTGDSVQIQQRFSNDVTWNTLATLFDGEDGTNGTSALTPELRSVRDGDIVTVQWRYAGTGSSWQALATLSDGINGLTPELRVTAAGLVQWKYTIEDSLQWRDLREIRDGKTAVFRVQGSWVQYAYEEDEPKVWTDLYQRVNEVDLNIIAPNLVANASIQQNELVLNIPRPALQQLRAQGQTVESRIETANAWNTLLTIDCCDDAPVTGVPEEPTIGMKCYALAQTLLFYERQLIDIINAYEAGLDPLQRTSAAEEVAQSLSRVALRAFRRVPGVGVISALFESDVDDMDELLATVTQTRRLQVQEDVFCLIPQTGNVLGSTAFFEIAHAAQRYEYGTHPDPQIFGGNDNWFENLIELYGYDEVNARYQLYLSNRVEASECALYPCVVSEWQLTLGDAALETGEYQYQMVSFILNGNYVVGFNPAWVRGSETVPFCAVLEAVVFSRTPNLIVWKPCGQPQVVGMPPPGASWEFIYVEFGSDGQGQSATVVIAPPTPPPN